MLHSDNESDTDDDISATILAKKRRVEIMKELNRSVMSLKQDKLLVQENATE